MSTCGVLWFYKFFRLYGNGIIESLYKSITIKLHIKTYLLSRGSREGRIK